MVLLVVYAPGAASPREIATGLGDLAELVFLVPPSAAQVQPLLEALGRVRPLTGDLAADIEAARAVRPAGIVTFSESMLRLTAQLAAALSLPFHDVETVKLLTDKRAQRAALRENGADDVRHCSLQTPADWARAVARVGLPAVIKPVRGEGSRDTFVAYDFEQAKTLLQVLFASQPPTPGEPWLVAEELLQGKPDCVLGDYVSVESFCRPDGVDHVAVTGKFPLIPPFREAGQFWPAPVAGYLRDEILELASRAIKALSIRIGMTHTEIKLTPAGPRIIEVNGRIGGHINELAQAACGLDLVRLVGRQALGEPVIGPAIEPAGVHFQFSNMAPTQACVLRSVRGGSEVRRMEGIRGYHNFVKPGGRIQGGVLTHELDMLWGECQSHTAMMDLIGRASTVLTFELEFPGREVRLTAAELMRRHYVERAR